MREPRSDFGSSVGRIKPGRPLHGQGVGPSRFSPWLPPLAWLGVIFWFSTDTFSADQTGAVLEPLLRWLVPEIRPSHVDAVHRLVRKGAHFVAYATLALLILRALRSGRRLRRPGLRRTLGTLAIVGSCALLDECHQSLTRQRTASLADSLIDVAGAGTALAAAAVWERRKARGWRAVTRQAAPGKRHRRRHAT